MAPATVPVREYSAPGAGVGSVVHTTVKNYYSNSVNNSKTDSSSSSSNCGNSSTLVFM